MKIKAMDVILDGIKKKTDNDNAIKYFTDIMDNYINITSLPEYKPFNGLYDTMVDDYKEFESIVKKLFSDNREISIEMSKVLEDSIDTIPIPDGVSLEYLESLSFDY